MTRCTQVCLKRMLRWQRHQQQRRQCVGAKLTGDGTVARSRLCLIHLTAAAAASLIVGATENAGTENAGLENERPFAGV